MICLQYTSCWSWILHPALNLLLKLPLHVWCTQYTDISCLLSMARKGTCKSLVTLMIGSYNWLLWESLKMKIRVDGRGFSKPDHLSKNIDRACFALYKARELWSLIKWRTSFILWKILPWLSLGMNRATFVHILSVHFNSTLTTSKSNAECKFLIIEVLCPKYY